MVGKFVEYFGHGSWAPARGPGDREHVARVRSNLRLLPVDGETLKYLRLTGRDDERLALVEAYCKENALWHDPDHSPEYSQVVELDLSTVEPSLAGPRRPQDRVPLREAKRLFLDSLESFGVDYGNGHDEAVAESFPASDPPSTIDPGHGELVPGLQVQVGGVAVAPRPPSTAVEVDGEEFKLEHGSVVIAAITSCTNTSNPQVMIGAGLLARKAVERGMHRKPWVKSSLAPGSKVVTEYYDQAGLTKYLDELGFQTVGYGCTTCIGNSGPLPEPISKAVVESDLVVCSVLSGNRNFEARIHPEVKANYLASPMLVVAYALAGRMDVDLIGEPLGQDRDGNDVYLRDLWPTADEIQETITRAVRGEMFSRTYADVFTGDPAWRELPIPEGDLFAWDPASTYVRQPPYFEGMSREPEAVEDVHGARCLVVLGDSVTTDHISPAGSISPGSPAGKYLVEHGVERKDFNSYGSRRGNHEVMVRGTFANVRLRNLMVPALRGRCVRAEWRGADDLRRVRAYRENAAGRPRPKGGSGFAGLGYKGPNLLGVRAVIAESYERIHRSNLLMMGILPLQFLEGETPTTLGLTGREEFAVEGVDDGNADQVTVRADGKEFRARVRLDTPREREYFQHGGILPYVLRRLLDT